MCLPLKLHPLKTENVLDSFLEMEFEDSDVYVLMFNIFFLNRRWNDDIAEIWRLLKVKDISKVPMIKCSMMMDV